MQIKELIKMVNGTNEKTKKPNSAFTLSAEAINPVTKNRRSLGTMSAHKPEIMLQRHGQDVQIDFYYVSPLDSVLRSQWLMLEKFGADLEALADSNKEMPVMSITIVPVEYGGKFYARAINPRFWALMPKRPGEDVNCIRIIFDALDVEFFSDENVDVREIDMEAKNEARNRDFIEQQEEALKEDKAFLDGLDDDFSDSEFADE